MSGLTGGREPRWGLAEEAAKLAGRCEEQPAGGVMSPVLGARRVVMGRVGEAGSRRRPASHFGVWSVLQTEEAMWVGWG